jgi:hypothetical protein
MVATRSTFSELGKFADENACGPSGFTEFIRFDDSEILRKEPGGARSGLFDS